MVLQRSGRIWQSVLELLRIRYCNGQKYVRNYSLLRINYYYNDLFLPTKFRWSGLVCYFQLACLRLYHMQFVSGLLKTQWYRLLVTRANSLGSNQSTVKWRYPVGKETNNDNQKSSARLRHAKCKSYLRQA